MNRAPFADRLLMAIESKRSHVVVGLDPDVRLLPIELKDRYAIGDTGTTGDVGEETVVACYREFLGGIIAAVGDEVVAVKPQIAYFEALGPAGYSLYEEVVAMASAAGLLVISDVKRADIGSTAEAYARAHLDRLPTDAVTVNPYFGTDGLEPFLARVRGEGKGIFVLVKTSNPSSGELQDVPLASGVSVYEHVADLVNTWGAGTEGQCGYQSVGAVVGGTFPSQGTALRRRMPRVPFLVPGYGAQGAQAADLAGMFDADGTGAVVNAARTILYAYRERPGDWKRAAQVQARDMRVELWKVAGRG